MNKLESLESDEKVTIVFERFYGHNNKLKQARIAGESNGQFKIYDVTRNVEEIKPEEEGFKLESSSQTQLPAGYIVNNVYTR